jgi:N6-adenosine-specific RNA methylase IME4
MPDALVIPPAAGILAPRLTERRQAEFDAVIVYARAIKDWLALELAVDAKIAEQVEHVLWWDSRVGVNQGPGRGKNSPSDGTVFVAQAEAATGITKQRTSRWRLRLFTDGVPDQAKQDAFKANVIRRTRQHIDLDDTTFDPVADADLIVPPGRYGTIVVDPPWPIQKIERDVAPNQSGLDYPTMTLDQLAAWPVVRDKAADDCHLFCWATQKYLTDAIALAEAWMFHHVLTFTWLKPGGFQPFKMPQYNTEFVVYARRGTPAFRDTTNFATGFMAPRREHSRKPDEFYETVRRVTAAPRIDIFSREARDGFAQYGNETARFA